MKWDRFILKDTKYQELTQEEIDNLNNPVSALKKQICSLKSSNDNSRRHKWLHWEFCFKKKRYSHLSEMLSKPEERETVPSSFHKAVSFIPESDKDVPTEENGRPVSFMKVDSSILRKNP